MNIFEAEEEIREIIGSSSHKYRYYEIFIYFENREKISERLHIQEISCYVETLEGVSVINSTFGTKQELRNIWDNLFLSIMFLNKNNSRSHRKINETSRCYESGKLTQGVKNQKAENVICEITSVSVEKIFFNSEGIRKCSTTPYYYANQLKKRRLLFCEKSMDKIYDDFQYETNNIESSIYRTDESNIIMISPRVTHLWLTLPVTQIVCTENYIHSIFTEYAYLMDNFKFSDLPYNTSSVFSDSFDTFGNDYIDRIYIDKGKYEKYTKEDQRFTIAKGQIKRALTFPIVEVSNNITIDDRDIPFFYDFIGKVDVFENYISGILLSNYKRQRVNVKWTSFLRNVQGSNGHYSNIKYVIVGRSPYLIVDKGGIL
ncbi:MAG: hypothetical protein E7255_15785 [Lachnospiraceae bacterium]|nr:hypothetical protein [Lachnospiraceae bacterium]